MSVSNIFFLSAIFDVVEITKKFTSFKGIQKF